jgi:hypothetical protein
MKRFVKARWSRRLTSSVLAGVLAMTATAVPLSMATPANAADQFNLWGCKFSTASLNWQDSTGYLSYGNQAAAAAQAWTTTATPIVLTKVTSRANIRVELENLGNNGTGGNTYASPCSGGNWTTTVVWRYNTGTMSGSTPTQLKQAAIHEFGHALGLDHYNANSCPNVQMMDPDTQVYTCGYTAPRPGDVAGINYLY